jgi:hypothetical protein
VTLMQHGMPKVKQRRADFRTAPAMPPQRPGTGGEDSGMRRAVEPAITGNLLMLNNRSFHVWFF